MGGGEEVDEVRDEQGGNGTPLPLRRNRVRACPGRTGLERHGRQIQRHLDRGETSVGTVGEGNVSGGGRSGGGVREARREVISPTGAPCTATGGERSGGSSSPSSIDDEDSDGDYQIRFFRFKKTLGFESTDEEEMEDLQQEEIDFVTGVPDNWEGREVKRCL